MERSARSRGSRPLSRLIRSSPYPLRSHRCEVVDEGSPKRTSFLALEKRDWEDATCSVCMEFPHNAVLLLCSSHDKGCRSYMCGTSYRHSNCLDQFKKAYTKINEGTPVMVENPDSLGLLAGGLGSGNWPLSSSEKSEVIELAACPLCRGQVKGWTVVEPAREYLNNKKRSCMQDECSFTGTYKELQKHVRSEHPCAKPREVDPTLEQKWRRLEHEREREDVISTIRSSMPRSVVFGDYVIEMVNSDVEDSEEDEVIGGDNADGGYGSSSRGISRSILYFFLREGARFMRLHRDPHGAASTIMDERDDDANRGYDVLPSLAADGGSADLDPSMAIASSSGGDDDYGAVPAGQVGGVGVLSAARRRRRRCRSRGRSVVALS